MGLTQSGFPGFGCSRRDFYQWICRLPEMPLREWASAHHVAHDLCIQIVRLGYEERLTEARKLQTVASALERVIVEYGTAGVKAALGLLGFVGMTPRSPFLLVDEEGMKAISEALTEWGYWDKPLWLF